MKDQISVISVWRPSAIACVRTFLKRQAYSGVASAVIRELGIGLGLELQVNCAADHRFGSSAGLDHTYLIPLHSPHLPHSQILGITLAS
jgi:hypothetical protein